MSKLIITNALLFLLPCMTLVFQAIEVAQIMDEALDANRADVVLRCIKIAESCVSTAFPIQSLTSESVSTVLHLFTASWVYSKVLTLGISLLEQERRYACGLICKLLYFFKSKVFKSIAETFRPCVIWYN